MIERHKITEARQLMDDFPAVAILGPRQVGKTTLARAMGQGRESIYLDLESERDRSKLADPGYYLHQHRDKLVVWDRFTGFLSCAKACED